MQHVSWVLHTSAFARTPTLSSPGTGRRGLQQKLASRFQEAGFMLACHRLYDPRIQFLADLGEGREHSEQLILLYFH